MTTFDPTFKIHPGAPVVLILAASLGAFASVVQAEPEASTVVAVFPLEDASRRLPPSAIDSLSEFLTSRIGRVSGFAIVPRGDLDQRLAAQKAESFKPCIDQACQIEIGKELAASKVMAARFTAIGKGCILSTYLFDLRTGTTDSTWTTRTSCDEDGALAAIDQAASQLELDRAQRAGRRNALLVGSLEVGSSPEGARISIDGAPTNQVTPATLSDVPSGQHRVTVETEAMRGEATAEIAPGTTTSIEVVMSQRPCLIAVSTVPEGAEIRVGDRIAGVSPVTIEVPAGNVSITATAKSGAAGRADVAAVPRSSPLQVSIPLALPVEVEPKCAGPTGCYTITFEGEASWSLLDREGKELCELPCTKEVTNDSGLVLHHYSRDGRVLLAVPKYFPDKPGSHLRAIPRLESGNGLLSMFAGVVGGLAAMMAIFSLIPLASSDGGEDLSGVRIGLVASAAVSVGGFALFLMTRPEPNQLEIEAQ